MYIEVNNIKKSYGEGANAIQVLRDVSASIEKGKMCVILGPSGSGKSTFLNTIGGLDEIDSGSIKVDGTEIILIALITYVISIFVMHSIDRETTVIGVLYALGVKRKQLITHYLLLPVIVTLIGGIVGTLIGFSSFAMEQQLSTTYLYYSIPKVQYAYPIYSIIYGVVIPPVVAIIVNYIAINNKLSVPALQMLRNEQKESRVSNIKIKKQELC